MMARPPTTRRSPVDASAVTPSPACTVALRTSVGARAAACARPAGWPRRTGGWTPSPRPRRATGRERPRRRPRSRGPAPIGSTATISGSPSSTVPRALSTAMFADPARSKARGSLYVMPLASASRWARAKCSADERRQTPSRRTPWPPRDIAARIFDGRRVRGHRRHADEQRRHRYAALDGVAQDARGRRGHVDPRRGTDRSLTHARSRPDHVVVMRRRFDRTRAPATSGSPSRRATSTRAPSQGTTRASPAVTIASTPTTSPASDDDRLARPHVARGQLDRVVALDGAHAHVELARSTPSRAAARDRASARRSPRPRSPRARPAPRAPRWTPPADRRRPAPTKRPPAAPPAGASATSQCGSDGSRRERCTRTASAAHAKTTSGTRATSATAPEQPDRRREHARDDAGRVEQAHGDLDAPRGNGFAPAQRPHRERRQRATSRARRRAPATASWCPLR